MKKIGLTALGTEGFYSFSQLNTNYNCESSLPLLY